MIDRGAFDEYDRALSANADLVAAAVRALASDLDGLAGDGLVSALDAEYPRLVTAYGTVASAAAVEFYASQREAAGVSEAYEAAQFYPKDWGLLRSDVATEATRGRELAAVLDSLAGRSQQRVMAYADETLMRNAQADPAHPRWAIVPHAGACGWCVMLGSNGFMYRSEGTADAARHPHCKCTPVVDFDVGNPSLAGYDPAAMRSAYRSCERAVEDDAREAWRSMGTAGRARYARNGKASYDAYLRSRVAAEMSTRDRGWLQTGRPVEVSYDGWSSRERRRLAGQEEREHRLLAENGLLIHPIPTDRAAPASIDLWMNGDFWELKSVTSGVYRISQRLDEAVRKWTRLHEAGLAAGSTPKVFVDNSRGKASDEEARAAILEKMDEHAGERFDEAYLIGHDLSLTHLKKRGPARD